MKVYVLGSNGMLGKYVSTYLSKLYSVINITRDKLDVESATEDEIKIFFKRRWWDEQEFPGISIEKGDVIVNCIGLIKPLIDSSNTAAAIKINSLFPYILSEIGERCSANVIHITTDCVWSGKEGNYNEDSPHDALDVYGKTKSLGEPGNCTVIRTSIIGEEVDNNRSLVEWIRSRKDKDANGFLNHIWNGVTCLELAKCIGQIIIHNSYWKGVRHIFSPTSVTKAILLKLINDIYNFNISINNIDAPVACDRSLSTKFDRVIDYDILELEDQIKEMKDFKL